MYSWDHFKVGFRWEIMSRHTSKHLNNYFTLLYIYKYTLWSCYYNRSSGSELRKINWNLYLNTDWLVSTYNIIQHTSPEMMKCTQQRLHNMKRALMLNQWHWRKTAFAYNYWILIPSYLRSLCVLVIQCLDLLRRLHVYNIDNKFTNCIFNPHTKLMQLTGNWMMFKVW